MNKDDIFMIVTFLLCLSIFSFILFEKIDYFYIFILSLATESFLKSIYDIKNETGNKSMYIYSRKTNQKLRYLAFFVSGWILLLILNVIYRKIVMPEAEFSIFLILNAIT
ncbi:hypothetical protein ACH5BK_08900 [Arcobacter sp. YIC-80]|uniref:hypothetical protein n=1 Tax=Arcobacter sp. YIC-80 TaxID=3376683 RepID=UPI003850E2D0